MKEKIKELFKARFGTEGVMYASAGRINLIGEHTDYNGGFVFPGAIDKCIMAEININGTDLVRAYSADLDDYCEFGLREEDAPDKQWARYIFGVCREIIKRGFTVKGFDTVVNRLQRQCYVIISDFVYLKDKYGRPYGWGVAEYSTPERFMGGSFTGRVYSRSPQESYERIVEHFRELFPWESEEKLKKFIG